MKARVSDILVVVTYAMVAVVAALAFQRFELMSAQLAWLMGAVVFLIAGQVHAAAARAEERARFDAELKSLQRANASMINTLNEAQARLDALSGGAGSPADRTDDAAAPRDETLVAQILARLDAARTVPEPAPARAEDDTDIAAMVREALDANRVDLYMQPVVGLPQRRTSFYEGFTRLRTSTGEVVAPGAFLAAAEAAGMIAEVDNLLLLRCVQIVRRLTKSDRRIGVFCNVSIRSLADEDFFPGFLDFLRRNGDLAGALIFEMPRAAFESRSAIAARNMARLADYGFRFSLDQVNDLNIDLNELQRAGVRFLKIPGERLVAALHGGEPVAGREPGALPPEDVAGLFARYGVDLVAEKIETEATVVEVLDLDIAYAQGHLFGAPRPVREEVLSRADQDVRRAG
ncbi:EAL domain-containing protein [Hyphomonadaceae bacterium BL14]|nr:EAL domain-containing protein [Hyphomonadaceae bacterium BL14]